MVRQRQDLQAGPYLGCRPAEHPPLPSAWPTNFSPLLTPAVPHVERHHILGLLAEPQLLNHAKPLGPVQALAPQRVHLAAAGGVAGRWRVKRDSCGQAWLPGAACRWTRVTEQQAPWRQHAAIASIGRWAATPASSRLQHSVPAHLMGRSTLATTSCFSGMSEKSIRS